MSYEPVDDLAPIRGRWASRGETVATDDEPSRVIVGIDTYEWMGGGRSMVHHVHVRAGDDLVEAIEMIGEPNDGALTMRSFDNTGAKGSPRD